MYRRVDPRLAAVSVLSFLFLTGVPRMSAAIGLDNDVVIDASECTIAVGTTRCATAVVTGAPRTVGAPQMPLDITVRIEKGPHVDGLLEVIAYDDQLREICFDPRTSCHALIRIAAGDFDENGTLHRPVELPFLPETAILAVKGRLRSSTSPPIVTIIVKSAGDRILADRIGDAESNFDPGDVADIPPRSIELIRALDRLEEGLFGKRAVELDVTASRTHVAVGWTHAFAAADAGLRRGEVDKATLRLFLLVGEVDDTGHCASDDVVLLDQAVNRVAAGRSTRLPVIFLSDFRTCQLDQSLGGSRFTIDLMKVPVRILSLEDFSISEPTKENLTASLGDGKLDVIVAGPDGVHYSALDITLKEPEER